MPDRFAIEALGRLGPDICTGNDRAMIGTDISEYLRLIQAFLDGYMPVDIYQRLYMDAFKAEQRIFDDKLFWLLNNLFTDLDVFEPDEATRLDYEIGLEELQENARLALQELRDLTP
jgi:hypothetical protein